jgi:hypothetical protein
MLQYLDILREASIVSIYILLAEVIILLIFLGKIKDCDLQIFAYVWLPIAAVTQYLMTYFRVTLSESNLPIMNIYFMIELVILVFILLRIRKKIKGVEINYKIWTIVVLCGILIHFTDELNSIHTAAIFYSAIVYFNITISFIDLDKIERFYRNHFAILNIGVFVKAFGYSYITIYQVDFAFPLYIHTAVNLLVQVIFFIAILIYYKEMSKTKPF